MLKLQKSKTFSWIQVSNWAATFPKQVYLDNKFKMFLFFKVNFNGKKFCQEKQIA